MLVARRDPPFHSDPTEVPNAPGGHTAHSRSTPRFITALQVAGSALGIPVGLVSGYSIYHANFSVEARCQGLRANIVSVLDKNANPSTLRMLVRHDVASFEAECGAINPDAAAAFRALLDSDNEARSAAAPVHKARPQAGASKSDAIPKPAPRRADAKPVEQPPAISDANWVESVRHALVRTPTADEAKPAPAQTPATPPHALGQLRQPSTDSVAPALPPAAAVTRAPVPRKPSNHPVPPASIPEPASAPDVEKAAQPEHDSGLIGLIGEIPLLGRVVGR